MPERSKPARFGDLLNYLFLMKQRKLPDGRWKRHTLRDVSNATGISIAYLSEARRGAKENPPKEFIELLAGYFEVSPAFFFGPLPGGHVDLAGMYQEALSDPLLEKIMLRAGSFGRLERQLLLDWMDSIERAKDLGEGRPPGTNRTP